MCAAYTYATVQECYSIGHVSVHIQFASSTVTLTAHDWLNQDHLQEKFFENNQSAHREFPPYLFHKIFPQNFLCYFLSSFLFSQYEPLYWLFLCVHILPRKNSQRVNK